MRPWLCKHRRGILLLYIALAVTAILILQVLEARGYLP
jgi:hypothetical protein